MLTCRELALKASDYLNGELSPWQRLQIRFHMLLCRHCSRYIGQLRLVVASLGTAGRGSASSPTSEEEIVDQLLREAAEQPGRASSTDAEVIIYTTAWCPYCRRAKALFKRKNIRYQEIDIGRDPSRRQEMVALAGGRTTVPQIFIGGRGIGGCDDLYALESSDTLDALLGRS
jgi:glutaredoxin 3